MKVFLSLLATAALALTCGDSSQDSPSASSEKQQLGDLEYIVVNESGIREHAGSGTG